MAQDAVKLPKRFIDDHEDRGLPTPAKIELNRHYLVSRSDPEWAELLDDARYYANDVDACERGLVTAARALVKAMSA
jgi:hypothetical protein